MVLFKSKRCQYLLKIRIALKSYNNFLESLEIRCESSSPCLAGRRGPTIPQAEWHSGKLDKK